MEPRASEPAPRDFHVFCPATVRHTNETAWWLAGEFYKAVGAAYADNMTFLKDCWQAESRLIAGSSSVPDYVACCRDAAAEVSLQIVELAARHAERSAGTAKAAAARLRHCADTLSRDFAAEAVTP